MKRVTKVVKNYLEDWFCMKKLLLFKAFLVSAPLFSGQQDPFMNHREQYLKKKINDRLFIDRTDRDRMRSMYALDLCLYDNFEAAQIHKCHLYKNKILDNDSSDITLKRRFLDYIFPFQENERSAIDYMADVIDKNINCQAIRIKLEQEDASLKEEIVDELSYRFFVNSWWTWLNHVPHSSDIFKLSLLVCLMSKSHSSKDDEDQCSVIKEFIKNYIPKLSSEAEQKIAQMMVDRIAANSAYNKAKIAYKDSLKDLYTQD